MYIKNKKKRKKHNSYKKSILLIMLLVVVLGLTICGGIYRDKRIDLQANEEIERNKQDENNKIAEKRKTNKWFDMKANFLGDSITYGLDPENHENVLIGYRYTDLIKEKCEFSVVNNYGIGGTTIAKTPQRTDSFLERYTNMVSDVDLIGIFGGVNDFGSNVVIGEVNDSDNTHFKSAFNSLIKGLLEKYPDKKIFVITPVHCQNDNIKNVAGFTLKDYVDAEIEVCKSNNIPVLDLYTTYGIDANNVSDKESYMPDGLHPNKNGIKILADKIIGFINTL